jgi:uncharacterized protein YcnI
MRFKRSFVVTTLAGVALAVGMTGTASAHVTVNPKSVEQGSYTKLTFRVPNERPDASTTKLEVNIPTDKPLASVSVQPQPGWSYAIEKTKLATPVDNHGTPLSEVTSKITWTADAGTSIKPGEFGEFNISAGPLPKDASSLIFRSLQTYSSGEVVRWIEVAEGSAEVEKPAPVLTLTPANSDAHGTTHEIDDVKEDDKEDDEADLLSIVAIGASIIAVALALGALLTRKR